MDAVKAGGGSLVSICSHGLFTDQVPWYLYGKFSTVHMYVLKSTVLYNYYKQVTNQYLLDDSTGMLETRL